MQLWSESLLYAPLKYMMVLFVCCSVFIFQAAQTTNQAISHESLGWCFVCVGEEVASGKKSRV